MPEAPATWDDRLLTPRLTETRFGDVRWFPTLDSTNRYLLDLAAEGGAEGVVAVAEAQTAGRGRLGRAWIAPAGSSLLASVLLRPTLAAAERQVLTVAAGCAAAVAVRELAGIDARLKWPNDLVVADRKLAGLLAEARGDAVVVGMGLNVAWDAFPPALADTATSCAQCSDVAVDREELLIAWLHAFEVRLGTIVHDGGPAQVLAEAAARSATLGRDVRVELADRVLEGRAVALTPEGYLEVVAAGRPPEVVAAGDVIHLRS